MSGIAIEYLLGLYFLVVSIEVVSGKVVANFVKLAFGILFIVMAFLKFSLIG